MTPEDRQIFIEEFAELITETLRTDLTVIICQGELGVEATTDGFNPEENPEMLETFMATMLGLVQSAIDQCGADYKLFVEQNGKSKNFSEVIKRLETDLHKKLN